ncbi:MAG: SusC/RagA family TonB-linked outer membrane protein [Bacteroidales bacterium]|nr:SusC/RagA family TonB-linked outer membrane protein [Bacteroidales bacterium]
MQLYNIFQKFRFASFFLILVLAISNTYGQAQRERRVRQTIDITIKVVDDSGNPVPGARVVVGEGVIYTETDSNGSVTFRAHPENVVTITSPAFEKNVSIVTNLLQNNTVTLVRSKLFMTSADMVALPFTNLYKRQITGPETIIQASSLEKYPSNDIRASLTGLTSGMDVRELYGWPGPNAQEKLGSFGATSKFSNIPIAIVDGIYTDLSEVALNASEIESITVNKGTLASAMFGPVAAKNGFLFITTKRGYANERILDVNIERGLNTVDRMPGWVGGADYARLNNQARINDGLTPNYTEEAISAYAKNDPYDKKYPSVNFREMMLKNNTPFMRANISASGGNDIVQYYSFIGYNNEGDIYKIGAKADYNLISTRQNVDVKINDLFSTSLSFYGNISIRRSPNYGYDPDFTSEDSNTNPVLSLLEMPSVLSDIITVPPVAFPVYAHYDEETGIPWYGISSNYTNNPIGNLVSQGYYKDVGRLGASSISLDFDIGKFVPGLKSKTFFGFNIYNVVRSGQVEDYDAYLVSPSISPYTGKDTILLSKSSSHTSANQTSESKLMDYYYQRYGFYEKLEYNNRFGDHLIESNLVFYGGKTFKNGVEEPERQANIIWHSMYSLKDRYSAELVLTYAGSDRFAKENRYRLFPSAGLSWVISEENFMSNINFIDFLKLRTQYGQLGVETFISPFYYIDRLSVNTSGSAFGAYSSNQWFGSTTDANVPRTSPQRIGNPDLGWEVFKEFNAGFDALLFNKSLSLEMTYQHYIDDGVIVQVSNVLPYVVGLQGARPWYNYTKTQGNYLLTDLNFTQKIGKVTFTIGGNITTGMEKRLKYDEPNYRYEYQKRTGKPSDAIFGLTYLGKFTTDAETKLIPQLFDAKLKAGDLKYADLNNDGFVDDNDQSMVGHSSPRMYYGIDATVRFGNIEFWITGAGRAFYDLALTNVYYWNGWGDNNYSNFVKDNIGGKYPRLTYYKVNNNFITSDFWLVKGGYFKIQNVELAYIVPPKSLTFMGGRGLRIYLRGANLLTISKVKDVDPESINSGVTNYPLFRTISGGVKFNF